jgi:hypothetical protein
MLLLTYVPKTHEELYAEAIDGYRCLYCLRTCCVAHTHGESVCG